MSQHRLFVFKITIIITTITAVASVIMYALAMMFYTESYLPFYPAIDTVFAPDYSEESFDLIHAGMTDAEVVDLIGAPLSKCVKHNTTGWDSPQQCHPAAGQGYIGTFFGPRETSACWIYSDDARLKIGDFAWLGRYVYFDRHNVVVGTRKDVHEN